MRNITWRLMIALLTFAVGVGAAMCFVKHYNQQTEETEKTVFVIDAALSGDSESADVKDKFYEVGGMIVTTNVGCIATKNYKAFNGTQAAYQSYFFESRKHAEREMRRLIKEGEVIKREASQHGKQISETVAVKNQDGFAAYALCDDEIVMLKIYAASSIQMLERFMKEFEPCG